MHVCFLRLLNRSEQAAVFLNPRCCFKLQPPVKASFNTVFILYTLTQGRCSSALDLSYYWSLCHTLFVQLEVVVTILDYLCDIL